MLRQLLPFVALCGLLAGCASAPSDDDAAGAADPAGAGFPVSVEHAFGTTEIPAEPTRVVALGVTDADPLLALGVTPVATAAYTFYEDDGGLGPWARDLVEGEPPQVLTGDPNPEQLAALAPDLIVAVTAGIDQQTYDVLSAIAPVLARPADTIDFGVPRDAQTRAVAAALGRTEQGEELIDAAEQAFTDAVNAHPEFEGRTASTVLPFDGTYGAYTPVDTRGRFTADLGFTLPQTIADLDDGDSFYVEVSPERVGLLDGDVLVMLADEGPAQEQVDNDQVLAQVPVVADGRMIVPDTDTRGAMTYNSVLSAPFALERLVPQIADAIGRS
ncbi:iron-siderophore ABC transporter substrate-binding protein [Pseudonocardia nematodicida]|uniref:Iron-siderophore ABC transporter substrate-binding protein n=1 Tax=Pseudonocardia nematodicida TaxID=1206997 RepID=A0ABV1K650_9PSEU